MDAVALLKARTQWWLASPRSQNAAVHTSFAPVSPEPWRPVLSRSPGADMVHALKGVHTDVKGNKRFGLSEENCRSRQQPVMGHQKREREPAMHDAAAHMSAQSRTAVVSSRGRGSSQGLATEV